MAVCKCFLNPEEAEALRQSQRIDRSLEQEKDQFKRQIKILLLGAGESGKSTFLKQMRIIHGQSYTDNDRLDFRFIIYHNIIKNMKVLVEAQRNFNISLSDPTKEELCDVLASYRTGNLMPEQFSLYADPLIGLWQDEGIQKTFDRRSEFQLVSAHNDPPIEVVYRISLRLEGE